MNTKKLLSLFLLVILALTKLIADDVLKIYHMQSSTESSNPYNRVIFQNKMFFTASGKLWQIDSTNTLKMIDGSFEDRYSFRDGYSFFVLNNELYYFSDENNLWHYNGQDAPAVLYNDVRTPYVRTYYKVVNNKLYYYSTAYNDTTGLYEFDGTNHPKKIASGFGSYEDIISYNNSIYFAFNDLQHGNEVWCYGNNQSRILSDLNSGPGSSYPENFSVYLGRLFFNAKDSSNTSFLWEYNGNGTPAKFAQSGSGVTICNNILYFTAQDSIHGISLWSYDGSNPPMIVNGTENTSPTGLFEFNEKLYFAKNSTIFEYDGVNPIKVFLGPFKYHISQQVINGCLYIWYQTEISDSNTRLDLYKYDGVNPAVNLTSSKIVDFYSSNIIIKLKNQIFVVLKDHVFIDEGDSLRIISDFPTSFTEMGIFGNRYYFTCDNPLYGRELWYFDGTKAPVLVKDFNNKMVVSGSHSLKVANDKLFFKDNANQNIQFNGRRFSVLPKEFNPVTVYNMLAYKDNYYYNRETGRFSSSLFKSDGLTEYKISNSSTCDLLVFHDTIYYGSHDNSGNSRYMLMKYDGVSAPVDVADMGDHRICYMKIVNDKIRLFAFDHDSLSVGSYDGNALIWQYKNMPIPYNSTFIGIQFNDKTVFSYDYDLWIYDETQKPVKLGDINAKNFTIYKDHLYFSQLNDSQQLWVYDGTNPPSVVSGMEPGVKPKYPSQLTVANNKLFFSAYAENNVNVLWVYDGVQKPTMVKDAKGDTLPGPNDLTQYRDNLYFTAITEQEGRQLYTICPNASVIHETGCDSLIIDDIVYKDNKWICDTTAADSIVWFDLSIAKPTYSHINNTSCNEYISPGGKNKWITSGVYSDTIPNAAGCDSIITVNLTVNHTSESSFTVQSCDFYISPGGKNWTTTGIYKDTIPSSCGCDSIITVNLQIDRVDTAVIRDGSVLASTDLNAAHQWIDAENNTFIEGETFLTYTPDQTGIYAVIVTQGTCVDTSSAYTVFVTGNENVDFGDIQLYPNPSNGKVTIELGKVYDEATVTIMNSTGMVVQKLQIRNSQKGEIVLNEPGMYLVKIRTGNGETIQRVIKQ